MTKLQFDNNVFAPATLTPEQRHDWNARMMAKASLYVDPETWDRLYKAALGEVLGTGKGGVR